MLRVCGGPGPAGADPAGGAISSDAAPAGEAEAGAEGEAAGGGGASANLAAAASAVSTSSSFFNIDARKKQVTLFDPVACGGSSAPEDRRVGVAAPKMFAFDAIFSQDDSQTEVCSSALTDVIHAVINGTDGCLFCFGHARLGKTYTMVGNPESVQSLGVIPCAISWLFRGINEQKQKTGARFSVRVSAVEVAGPSQRLKDLLAEHATDSEQSPGVYLRDDPLFGTQLQNQSELRVPSAEKAAFYLDAALSSRSGREDGRDSHLLYTLHVYQYSVAGKGGVAGGRSRLHLIDLGSCERGKASGGISLSGLGNVLLAIFNGQKHLPYREHKVTQLLKECLTSLTCHAAMIAHVSPYAQHYTDTLATVQLASRIHRMRRRKIKFGGGSAGSGGSSGEEAARLQAQENGRSTGSSDVDPSSSEQSADTVIYVGPSDDATDGEHPPVYIPSLNSGDNRCAMGKALRGSGAEHRPTTATGSSARGHSTKTATQASRAALASKNTGGATEEKGSPSHRSISSKTSVPGSVTKSSSPAHVSSCKSSPVRTLNKAASNKASGAGSDQCPATQGNSKIPVPFNNTNGTVSGSDEHWIDGPRISKSKVAEARSLLKDSHKKKETWIDGPMQLVKGHAGISYGFMDSHKKNMIRKWVENQTVQIQQSQKQSSKGGSPKSTLKDPAKENSVSKANDEDNEDGSVVKEFSGDCTKVPLEKEPLIVNGTSKEQETNPSENGDLPTCSDDDIQEGNILCEVVEDDVTSVNNNLLEQMGNGGDDKGVDEEQYVEDSSECLSPTLQMHHNNKEISIDVSMNSLDVRLCILQEQNELGSTVGDDDDDVEIIEVEEPCEPVPMQDCCLQVTEEDIALCMGELENPLPEVDQESCEEHPLRILSQENLTVVSTFTDSLSVATDLEHTLPGHRFGMSMLSEHAFQSHRPYSLYEFPDDYIGHTGLGGLYTDEIKRKHNSEIDANEMIASKNRFDQLARLHEMYRHKLARTNATKAASNQFQTPQYRPPSRYQSLSLSDMLYNTECHDHSNTALGYTGSSSIYSEPAYNVHSLNQDQTKICDNCKMSFTQTGSSTLWYRPILSQSREHLVGHPVAEGNSPRFCAKVPNGTCNISSLRHPDGASNPNLKEEVERVPGNGASTSDHEDDVEERKRHPPNEEVRTVTGKANDEEEDDDDPPPVLPPPLPAPVSSRLHRRLFSKACARLKPSSAPNCPEGYDSGHDSSSPRPAKASPFSLRFSGKSRPGCESSGYESVVRDSESSSFGSSQDSDHGSRAELHDPGGAAALSGAAAAAAATAAGGPGGRSPASSSRSTTSNKVPVLQYCREDVERLERRWTEVRGSRIRELRNEQAELKKELAAAKARLLIPPCRWSYELHVEASMDHRNPSFVEALQRETEILRKRVEACKSHILMVTCFDALPKPSED